MNSVPVAVLAGIIALSGACAPKPVPTEPSAPETAAPIVATPTADVEPKCTTTNECVVLDDECGRVSVVHQNSEASQLFGSETRGECEPVRAPAMAISCSNGLCVSTQIGLEELREPCSMANHCEVVQSVCGNWEVVAASKADAAKKYFAGQAALVKCKMPDPLPPKPQMRCINHYCAPEY